MDRILYFRIIKQREYAGNYRVQVFRSLVRGMDVVYLQVCGEPSIDAVLQVKDEMQKALDRILFHTRRQADIFTTYMVYEESFVKWLERVRYEKEWRRLWRIPLYAEYHNQENLYRMLETIPGEKFPKEAWVLGYGRNMREWLPRIAGKLRSLTFYVEFMTKGFEEILEDLEESFGLVAEVKLILPGELRKKKLRSPNSVLVIDYSGNEMFYVGGMSPGTIWLDMDSVEAKRHSMEDRRCPVTYISLKNLWKKEMVQTLDTVGNFEYNTEVKIDRLGG